MRKVWKWILGIFVVLVVLALVVGGVFLLRSRFNGFTRFVQVLPQGSQAPDGRVPFNGRGQREGPGWMMPLRRARLPDDGRSRFWLWDDAFCRFPGSLLLSWVCGPGGSGYCLVGEEPAQAAAGCGCHPDGCRSGTARLHRRGSSLLQEVRPTRPGGIEVLSQLREETVIRLIGNGTISSPRGKYSRGLFYASIPGLIYFSLVRTFPAGPCSASFRL